MGELITCWKCEKQTDDPAYVSTRFKLENGTKSGICKPCQTFELKRDELENQQSADGEIVCPKCGRTFYDEDYCYVDQTDYDPKVLEECPDCGEEFLIMGEHSITYYTKRVITDEQVTEALESDEEYRQWKEGTSEASDSQDAEGSG